MLQRLIAMSLYPNEERESFKTTGVPDSCLRQKEANFVTSQACCYKEQDKEAK